VFFFCRMNLHSRDRKQLITTPVGNPVAIAYDWVHLNLYWADGGLHSGDARIEVLMLPARWRRTLLNESVVKSPTVMAVDPRPDQG